MSKRNLILAAVASLIFLVITACSVPALSAAQNKLPAAIQAVSSQLSGDVSSGASAPGTAPSTSSISSANVTAIQNVIQQANQEQIKAVTAHDPKIMQDTATSTYYQQSVQNLNDLLNSGVTKIQLANLQWGPITLKDANTAQATTSETWSTTMSDGSTMQQTDTNIYTVVLQNGAWKVQDDQHPNAGTQSPSGNPNGSPNPVAPVAPSAPIPGGSGQSQSRNWAGYAATGGKFTAVSGSWIVPNVSPTTQGVDASWVGIGGVNSTDLIQAGTQAVVQSGQVTYSAWWETLPRVSQPVPLVVHAGDKMSVSITQQSDASWLIVINDTTDGQSWQKNVTYRSSLSSAEWIEEAPVAGRMAQLPLDAFGAITFSNSTTVENGQTRTISQAGGQPITMGNGAGQALAQATALVGNGDTFTVNRTSVVSRSGLPGSGGFPGRRSRPGSGSYPGSGN